MKKTSAKGRRPALASTMNQSTGKAKSAEAPVGDIRAIMDNGGKTPKAKAPVGGLRSLMRQ